MFVPNLLLCKVTRDNFVCLLTLLSSIANKSFSKSETQRQNPPAESRPGKGRKGERLDAESKEKERKKTNITTPDLI